MIDFILGYTMGLLTGFLVAGAICLIYLHSKEETQNENDGKESAGERSVR